MEASDYLIRSLKRRWLWIVLATTLAVLAAYAVTEQQPERYEATSRVLVGPPNNAPVETLRAAGLLAHSYANVAVAENRLVDAADAAGLSPDLDELREMVTVTANETTRIVTITVVHEDAQVVGAVASSLTEDMLLSGAREVPTLAESLTATENVGPPAGMLTLIDQSAEPSEPIEQPTLLLLILAGVVAAALAATVAVALEAAPWRQPPPNLEGLVHRRFLGRISMLPTGPFAGIRKRRARGQAQRERQLVTTKLQHLTAGRTLGSLAVFGGQADDGSPTVAVGLASTFADGGRSVVIVDLTSDRGLARSLKLNKREREVITVDDVVLEFADIERGDTGGVRFLVSDARRVSEEAPSSRHLVDLLGEVADLVIVVAPPMLLEFGTLLVAQRTDGTLLVAAEDAASVEGAIEAYDLLERQDVTVLGTVLAARNAGDENPAALPAPAPAGAPSGGWSSRSDPAMDQVRGR